MSNPLKIMSPPQPFLLLIIRTHFLVSQACLFRFCFFFYRILKNESLRCCHIYATPLTDQIFSLDWDLYLVFGNAVANSKEDSSLFW